MKKIISICACIMLFASIVGCGSSETTTVGNTKADTTSAAIQVVNESSETSVESIEEVSNSSSESVSLGSGKYEDYWDGDSYFDIEGFAVDNGSTFTLWLDRTETENIGQAVRCTFYFKDGWKVSVITSDSILIEQNGTRTDFLIVCDSKSNHYVSLCKENNVSCSEEVLQSFNTIVECLKTSSDKANPFEGSGLNY